MNLTFRNLRAFIAIARFGTFTSAADHLLLSQPALTASIQQLEDGLGVRLFDRSSRGVSLTVEGREFLPLAEKLLADADAAVLNVRSLAERRRGSVGIASVSSFANRVLSVAIPRFTAAFPGISVRLRIADSPGVHRLVAEKLVDFGFASRVDAELSVRSAPLLSDPVGLICRSDHPIASAPAGAVRELIPGHPFIGLVNGEAIFSALADALDFVPMRTVEYEIENLAVLVALLRGGVGFSVVPAMTFPDHEPDLTFLPLAHPPQVRHLHFLTHPERSLSTAAHSMKRQIDETIATILDGDSWLGRQMRSVATAPAS